VWEANAPGSSLSLSLAGKISISQTKKRRKKEYAVLSRQATTDNGSRLFPCSKIVIVGA
jgi:hypothetical protein